MDFQEFIRRLEILKWGVVAFNTYRLNGENHCYIMVGEKGNTGKFHKRECKASELNQNLDSVFEMLKR